MQKTIIFSGIICLLLGIILGGYWVMNKEVAVGSVTVGNEYTATTTDGMPTGPVLGHHVLKSSSGVLGSVVIASSSSLYGFKVWNATSTNDISSSTVALFDAAALEGTYTFDAVMDRGIFVEIPTSFDGQYTITFR